MIQNKQRLLFFVELYARAILVLCMLAQSNHIFSADITGYFDKANGLSIHHLPYVNFIWEYPPLTTLTLLFVPLAGGNQDVFYVLFILMSVSFEYTALNLVRRLQPDKHWQITAYWSAVVVPISLIAWFRQDYMSVLLATVAIYQMQKHRSPVVAIVLGFLAKLWPLFLCVNLFARRQFRQCVLAVASCIVATGLWWALTPKGFENFLKFRNGGGFQIESIPGGFLLLGGRHPQFTFGAWNVSDSGYHWLQPILQVATVLIPSALALVAMRRHGRVNELALGGAVVCVILCCSRLLSPQFLSWLAPFVALTFLDRRRIGVLFAVAVVITLPILYKYNLAVQADTNAALAITARNLILVWLTVEFIRLAFRPPKRVDISS